MWSQPAVPSIVFTTNPSKPSSAAVRSRSSGQPLPAEAAAPSGLWFIRA